MTEPADQNPYGRGFVAACIVIGAVLLCGGVLIIAGLSDSAPAPAPAAVAAADATTPAGTPEPVGPATPSPAGTTNGCGLPDGDQAVPTTAPPADGWEVNRRVVVPRSTVYGPAKVDADGFRRCFAHSPGGAVFAAYHAIAAMADQRRTVATVTKLMLPGPATEALLRELRAESVDEESDPSQVAGYRVIDASRDRVTMALAMPVESAYVSAILTLVWHDGDWRVVPPHSRARRLARRTRSTVTSTASWPGAVSDDVRQGRDRLQHQRRLPVDDHQPVRQPGPADR
jgi:hypothetical protein